MLIRGAPEAGVLRLRLCRPERLNALTLALARQLLEAIEDAARDEQVRVILLSGEGPGFTAGKDRDDPPTPEFVAVLQQLASALMNAPQPVVAAVHGWAVGAGVEILLNCDLVLAARSAKFMLPEVNVGLFGTGGVLALLPQAVGLAKAKGALLLGEAFSAEQAERWGLIWSVVEDEQLQAQAQALGRQLAAKDPAILREIKALLHQESIGELDAVLKRETLVHERLLRR